jgi:allantoate deiminase
MRTDTELAAQLMQRIDALAAISEEPGRLTRTYGSPAMRQANDLVAGWMRGAGMTVEEDAIGNLIGRYAGGQDATKTFLLGSHLDTVRDAGRFDGALGVLVALACIEKLHSGNQRLPFAVSVLAFADEEGVRFHSSYLGSRVVAGTFDFDDLKRTDCEGISLREAILRFGGDPDVLHGARLDSKQLLGYVEVHIEQGPVLESKRLPVGVVSAIAGQSRISAGFTGLAAHAGTTPMAARRDALAAAAQFIMGAEKLGRNTAGLVVTVGEISVEPGASNVIPGRARLSVDVRHPEDAVRESTCEALRSLAAEAGADRLLGIDASYQALLSSPPPSSELSAMIKNLKNLSTLCGLDWQVVQSTSSVQCSKELSALLKEASVQHVPDVLELPSGAGHDAAALAAITPVAMLFVRCKDGISHHPDEAVAEADVLVAIRVLVRFLELLAKKHG